MPFRDLRKISASDSTAGLAAEWRSWHQSSAWTLENGFVTPTLKVKRMRIEEAYASHYQDWLHERKPVVWSKN